MIKILLLEDNSTDAELTQRSLTGSVPGCTVSIAPSLKEARELIKNGAGFDIALLDMSLPDGNGQELLAEIRQAGVDMAVVMLTGSGNEEIAVAALKAGADDYVVKRSGYISQLPATIEFALQNYKQNQQLRAGQIRVLYIEHHTSDIDLTMRHLRKYAPSIHIDPVLSSAEGLAVLPGNRNEPGKYDVILMDYRLPGLNALEFIKIIRQERKLDIPIILVSGHGSEDIVVQALRLGASEYLVKRDNYLFRLPSLITSAYQHFELKRKQQALTESESKYRLLAENSGDVIFTLDMDLNYTYISPAIMALRGYTPEEAAKQEIEKVLTPESYKRAVKLISESLYIERKLLKNLLTQKSIELEMIRKDGSTIWTEVKASLILDENNEVVGILGVTRDISKRKSAMDELRKVSRAVEQSPDSILITNARGEIEYINPALSRISGYASEELMGKDPRIFSSGTKTKDEIRMLWHTISKGDVWEGEFQNKKKNGELYWESATISPVTDNFGAVTHYLAIRKDITEQKRMTQELIEAKERAEESDRLKSAFLANMSHEIRTPMNGILGFTSLLLEPDLSSEERFYYIEIVQKSGQRMLNTINDIIEISKIEAGLISLKLTSVNVNERLYEINEFFTLEAKQKGLQLTFENMLPRSYPDITTDKDKLDSILANLVKNAIKYTDRGTVKLGCNLNGSMLEFYVKDTGIGIPADRQAAVFNRFEQADIGDKQAFQGSGLGLAIAKSYIEMLGGEVRVESEVGIGSTFSFTIPVNVVMSGINEGKNKANKSSLTELQNLKVLIAEDDEDSFSFLKRILFKNNIRFIIRASNGLEAINAVKENPDISIILMDIKMPDMNGIEATQQIRQFNATIPILAQTAYAFPEEKEIILNAGCNDFISKPIKQDELIDLIYRYTRSL